MANRLSPVVSTGIFGGGAAATSISANFTTPASSVSNACVVIHVMQGDGTATISSVTVTPQGQSAQNATVIDTGGTPGTSPDHPVAMYQLTGSFATNTQHTVTINYGAAVESWGYAELIEDVHQSSPVRDSTGTYSNPLTGGTGIISVNVTSAANDLVLSVLSSDDTSALVVSGDQTDHTTNSTSDMKHLAYVAGASPSVDVEYTNSGGPNRRTGLVAASFQSPDSTTTTLTPSQATLTLNGQTPSINPFTNVRIREVLVNEAGSPLGNLTGISLLVWYGGSPVGVPDLSYSALTTDANGTTSWSLATGSLVYNQNIFYVATDGGASLSMYTCARMIPSYE